MKTLNFTEIDNVIKVDIIDIIQMNDMLFEKTIEKFIPEWNMFIQTKMSPVYSTYRKLIVLLKARK